MIDLKGRVTIVTGASRGIGAAASRLLAEAGSDLILHYHQRKDNAEALADDIRAIGRRAVTVQGNLAFADTARSLVTAAVERLGRLDIVVNNAGIWTRAEMGQTCDSVWRETIDVNLSAVFNVCNAAIPFLKKSDAGRIINVSSTAGQRGEAFHSHYAASKGGVIAFSKSLAVELAPFNILVNVVAPGWVDTDMNASVFADLNFRKQAQAGIPLGRIPTAEDIAGPILFLASNLSRHMTGSTLSINGGSVLV